MPGPYLNPVELVFARPNAGQSPVDLVFGADESVALPRVSVDIQATLRSSLGAQVVVAQPVRAAIYALLTSNLGATARAVYDNRVTPWKDQRAASPFNVAAAKNQHLPANWETSVATRQVSELLWAKACEKSLNRSLASRLAIAVRLQAAASWTIAICTEARSIYGFEKAIENRLIAANSWQVAVQRNHQLAGGLQTGVIKSLPKAALWQTAISERTGLQANSGASMFRLANQPSMPWRTAIRGRPGTSALPPVVPVLPIQLTADLLFECSPLVGMPLELLFGFHPCGGLPAGAGFFILPARFYMTTHSLVARRLPDMAEVPLYECTLSADVGSFAWQFSASGPDSLFAQLAPTMGPTAALPQLLQVTLDGLVWVFIVESLKRDHTFGKQRISISGRSQTALVGAPWLREAAYNNPNAANAQQLAAQALALSGVAVDWGITDWLVPANAWSYTGSALAAVQAIAEAAGGYLQSHRSAPTLQVRHPYPPRPSGDSGGPWNWGLGAADVALATDAIITSGIERRDGADINAVYASGTSQGVLALIKRAGTAGEKLAAMQTDALITASQAAQQRGLAMLGKAGPQYAVSLELPVLTGAGQPGVIDVGSLVQVNDTTPWRGRVRGVQVNAAMPTARQTITLERHL